MSEGGVPLLNSSGGSGGHVGGGVSGSGDVGAIDDAIQAEAATGLTQEDLSLAGLLANAASNGNIQNLLSSFSGGDQFGMMEHMLETVRTFAPVRPRECTFTCAAFSNIKLNPLFGYFDPTHVFCNIKNM